MEAIKLRCKTKHPMIQVLGYGDFSKGDEFVFPANVAKELLRTCDWEEVKLARPQMAKKSEEKE